jgi:hypothetical protein
MFFIAHHSAHVHNNAYSGLFGSNGRQTITVQAISRSAHKVRDMTELHPHCLRNKRLNA